MVVSDGMGNGRSLSVCHLAARNYPPHPTPLATHAQVATTLLPLPPRLWHSRAPSPAASASWRVRC